MKKIHELHQITLLRISYPYRPIHIRYSYYKLKFLFSICVIPILHSVSSNVDKLAHENTHKMIGIMLDANYRPCQFGPDW